MPVPTLADPADSTDRRLFPIEASFAIRADVAFDHVVHVVHDPETTRLQFERELGLHTVRGGEHAAWGTWNTLSYFGLPYMEWLGVNDPGKAETAPFGRAALHRISIGEGGLSFAIRTNRMDALVRLWRQRGLDFAGPIEASRKRPDGSTLHWRMLFPEPMDATTGDRERALLPFVIEWGADDEERLQDLRATGALVEQPLYRLTSLHLATGDPLAWARRFSDYFGDGTMGEGPGGVYASPTEAVRTRIGDVDLHIWPIRWAASRFGLQASDPFAGPVQIDLKRVRLADVGAPDPLDLSGLRVQIQ